MIPIEKNYTWIIGDIHGMYDHLNYMLKYLKGTGVKKYIFLGDYIDEGPSPKEVIDKIISLKEEKVCLMGDHEHMMLDEVLAHTHKAILPRFLWEFNGGTNTIEAFGYESIEEFYEKTPKEYGDFFESLKITHTEEFQFDEKKLKFIFAHAGIYPFLPLEEQLNLKNYSEFTKYFSEDKKDHANSPVWVRNSFFDGNPNHWEDYIVIHGHTPTQKMHYFTNLPSEEEENAFSEINPAFYIPDLPFFRKHPDKNSVVSINLDTGVEHGRRLTALGISPDNVIKNEYGTFLKLEIIQVDSKTGFSSENTLKFFEYKIDLDKQGL